MFEADLLAVIPQVICSARGLFGGPIDSDTLIRSGEHSDLVRVYLQLEGAPP